MTSEQQSKRINEVIDGSRDKKFKYSRAATHTTSRHTHTRAQSETAHDASAAHTFKTHGRCTAHNRYTQRWRSVSGLCVQLPRLVWTEIIL